MRLFRPNIWELKARRDIEGLIEALKDSDVWVRQNAAEALGKIGDRRAVGPLIEALEDSEAIVRSAAEKALEKIALNTINEAHSLLQQAKKLGINTKNEEGKLNNAKLKLDEKDFSTAIKLANECKNSLDLKIKDYKQEAERRAKQSLDIAYSKIKEAEKLGINVSDAKDLHKKAILEFDNRAYKKAIEYAEKSRKAAEDKISRYNHAKEQIEASKDIVKSIKKLVSIPKAEELIEKAESALKIGNYNSAVKLAKEAEEEALRVKKNYENYKETSESIISSIESELTKIKNSGVKIPESEELIEHAKSELNNNNFERVKELAEEARRIAIERREEYNRALSFCLLYTSPSPRDRG